MKRWWQTTVPIFFCESPEFVVAVRKGWVGRWSVLEGMILLPVETKHNKSRFSFHLKNHFSNYIGGVWHNTAQYNAGTLWSQHSNGEYLKWWAKTQWERVSESGRERGREKVWERRRRKRKKNWKERNIGTKRKQTPLAF